MEQGIPPASAADIVAAGVVAGSFDIAAASLINLVTPASVLRFISSGLFGHHVFTDGPVFVLVGLLLQWVMSIVIAAPYLLAARRLDVLRTRPVRCGSLYGVGIYVVMNFAVVPLSAAPSASAQSSVHILFDVIAMVLFAIIIAILPSHHQRHTRSSHQRSLGRSEPIHADPSEDQAIMNS